MKESAVRMATHRLRRRYGELLRAEIAATVSKPGRARPVFAGPHSLWAQAVTPCPGACDGPVFGAVFLIDTVTKAERALPMQSLQDVDVFYS